jgi:site-specific DNA-methyltransferase (adenine-specific)
MVCRLSRAGDVVADPFAGRGTLPLEACIERRVGVGGDLSPLAHLLTVAKVATPGAAAVGERLANLRVGYSKARNRHAARAQTDLARLFAESPPEVAYAFHPDTLKELTWLRGALSVDDHVDAFIMAALAGALHGPGTGFVTSMMSNAVSRSPMAARASVLRRGHVPERRDTFRILARKLDRALADGAPMTRGLALRVDARVFGTRCRAALRALGLPPARLVVTSPPYLGVLRYGQYNWLRMWLLGANAQEVDASLGEYRPAAYTEFIAETLANLRVALAPDAVVVLLLGDVRVLRGHPLAGPPLAHLVWERAARPAGYLLVGVASDPISPTRKVTKLWGSTAGAATAGDTMLILATGEAGRRRALAGLVTPVPWPDRSSIQRRARAHLPQFAG